MKDFDMPGNTRICVSLSRGEIPCDDGNDKRELKDAIEALRFAALQEGFNYYQDAFVRRLYASQIQLLSDKLDNWFATGRISGKTASKIAYYGREVMMQTSRAISSAPGRVRAEIMKPQTPPYDYFFKKNIMKTYQNRINNLNITYGEKEDLIELSKKFSDEKKLQIFNDFSRDEKNNVYNQIVQSGGRSRESVNKALKSLKLEDVAVRNLVYISLAVSVYNVITAKDKVKALHDEVKITAAGILGGMLGGATAGLACGPASFICSSIGMFVGGAFAAYTMSYQLGQ